MFVDRNENGNVRGVYTSRQHDGQEELPDDHADVAAFYVRLDNAVPQSVSAGQIIRALADLDLLDGVDAAVAQADIMTQRLWARAPTFARNDAMVTAVASAVGQTEQQLDDIFRLAATK